MARLIKGLTALLAKYITHEGAAAIDLSKTDPLLHLTFTKGACLFNDTFYRTQAEELFSYSRALMNAERHEAGFAWKFAAYMRDPKQGKGNRIQGTIAAAILSAAFPEYEHAEEYVYKCLRHRADDLVIFVTHFHNMQLGEIPEAAKKAIARAANEMDEYQLLKYASRRYPIARRRKNGHRASLRLVDALGIARRYLNEEKQHIYRYLHAPTRKKDELSHHLQLAPARRRFFHGGTFAEAELGRLSVEQILSARKSTPQTWLGILDMEGLLPDMAFKQYLGSMVLAGVNVDRIALEARHRNFAGIWPHQVMAGFNAVSQGIRRMATKKKVAYSKAPCLAAAPLFDVVLQRIGRGMLPPGLNLGIADISPSMYQVPLVREHSSVTAGDAATLFAAMMSNDLGYAATFSTDIQVLHRRGTESDLTFAQRLHMDGTGWGSTQVAGSVVSLIVYLMENPRLPRPRTLYFFSDMQFHPPQLQFDHVTFPKNRPDSARGQIAKFFDGTMPPLLSAIQAYRHFLGPVDVVLWTLASYDNAPVPSTMDNVLMVSGFDVNTFAAIAAWQESRPNRNAGIHSLISAMSDAQSSGAKPSDAKLPPLPTMVQRQHAEIERIRSF